MRFTEGGAYTTLYIEKDEGKSEATPEGGVQIEVPVYIHNFFSRANKHNQIIIYFACRISNMW